MGFKEEEENDRRKGMNSSTSELQSEVLFS